MNRKHRLVSKVVIKNGQDSGISDYDYVEMKSNLLGVFLLVLCILGQCTDCRVLLQFKENDPKRILGTVDVEDCGNKLYATLDCMSLIYKIRLFYRIIGKRV